MPVKRNRKQFTVTMRPEVIAATHDAARKVGLSTSQFVEMILRANCQLTGPVQDLMKGLFSDLLEVDKTVTPIEKKEIIGLFDDEPKKKPLTTGKEPKASGRAIKRK
jgi:hypothetical protein